MSTVCSHRALCCKRGARGCGLAGLPWWRNCPVSPAVAAAVIWHMQTERAPLSGGLVDGHRLYQGNDASGCLHVSVCRTPTVRGDAGCAGPLTVSLLMETGLCCGHPQAALLYGAMCVASV